MTFLAVLLASVGYVGYAPLAPGTVGSAAGLLVYAVVRWTGWTPAEPLVIAALYVVGIWAASVTARRVGDSDPGIVVIDEVVGMLVTLAFVPVGVVGALVGFFFFRLFDVLKPFPAAQSEALPGGLGIMTDDLFAGLYAQLVVRILAWVWPAWMLYS